MHDRNLRQRLIVIGVIVLLGLFFVFPPQQKLLPGLDIAGGTSLIFEIEEEPGENNPLLAEQMKTLLQRRVDPKGVYDLVWRVVGRNRLEVQMPLPPAENAELKKQFQAAIKELDDSNIKLSQIEAAVAASADQRPAVIAKTLDTTAARDYFQKAYGGDDQSKKLARLEEDRKEREALFNKAVAARETLNAAIAAEQQALATQPADGTGSVQQVRMAKREAADAVEDAAESLYDRNLDLAQFQDVLDLDASSNARKGRLNELYAAHPSQEFRMANALAKFEKWREKRVLLEGSADLVRLLRGSGILEFRILPKASPENLTKYDRYREQLDRYGPRQQRGDTEAWFKIDNPLAFLNINTLAELNKFDPKSDPLHVVGKKGNDWYVLSSIKPEDGLLHNQAGGQNWKLVRASQSRDQNGRPSVNFLLDTVGGSLFRDLTRRNIGNQLCIFVDDVAYSSANIHGEIGTSGEITGDFSAEKIRYLIQTMQAGSLPGKLKDTPISERTIGSSLGEENLTMALRAALIGLAAVLIVMILYYWQAGMIANVALLMNVLLVLAAMAMLGARFNLPGIAGIILGIGMAVDANVLIYERMREEKERGSSLRMIIKNGYDKAFGTIFDSNVTTLLTCAILYYVGSEEIKGFGLTLGWGVALNMFTAVFVTRTLFSLMTKYNVIKDLKMAKLIGVPNVDWYAKRKFFVPLSLTVTIVGLGLLFIRDKRDTLDVEFLGGVNAEVQIKPQYNAQFDDAKLRDLFAQQATSLKDAGQKLSQASIAQVEGSATDYRVAAPGVDAPVLSAMLAEPLEDGPYGKLTQRAGVRVSPAGDESVIVRLKEGFTLDNLKSAISGLGGASGIALDAENLEKANIGRVKGLNDNESTGKAWSITTVVSNKRLVQQAIVSAFGDALDTKPRLHVTFRGTGERPFAIDRRPLADALPGLPPEATGDLTDFQTGAAMLLTDISPPQTLASLQERLDNMRLQPDYAEYPHRTVKVFGAKAAGKAGDEATYESVVVAVAGAKYSPKDDEALWASAFAMPEKALVEAALQNEQTLRKVTAFKAQIADQAWRKALLAVFLSWVMIIAYMWVRFGKMRYGVAGVVALVHDVSVALAFVGISGWIGTSGSPLRYLLIEDFKIDMTIIAAILTIIGFSINDTIVIFDRVREMRGRLGRETIKVVNDSINQTLSRTLLTTGTVMLTLLAMYIFGGTSIRPFTFCMIIGCITGTYSTLAIASPLLLVGMVNKEEEAAAKKARLAMT